MIDERTELLINRRLDGELNEDEALELNKRLIRSPEARRLFEDYERDNAAAADALHAFLRPEIAAPQRDRVAEIVAPRGWSSRLGFGIRAIAAAMLLTTMVGMPSYWRSNSTPEVRPGNEQANLANILALPTNSTPGEPAVDGPREETHRLRRNVVGVWDEETQSVYVLELDEHAQRVVPVAKNF